VIPKKKPWLIYKEAIELYLESVEDEFLNKGGKLVRKSPYWGGSISTKIKAGED